MPSKNTQGDANARKNVETATTVQGDEQEALPAPQRSSRKSAAGRNATKAPKASSSKNMHRVEEQVMENPEFLDDLALNNDDNTNDDAAEGQPMGTGITSRFNLICAMNTYINIESNFNFNFYDKLA